ncbi:ergosterol biosynthesis protein-like protein Erg28 [Thelonectria olida]|uniref:Ergosterol biosynthesis protein-like protein Erg28 n=1 Tax=Thelonectria olida TaxID=1576542 RepID=A0A9P8WF20_9HYPO|nr:ergosterol biosynthesis protein-like protein Erg28 [Thelonectria olida]
MLSLPPSEGGYLPYFLLYAGGSAIIHSVVCYLSSAPTALVSFQGVAAPPPHGLTARVYGVKNVYTSLIRLYAAYHIRNAQLYDLAILTFVGVLGLYVPERFVYGTVRTKEALFPFVTAGLAIV